jgi:para-aminobenzoate synthetase component 1
MSENNPPLCESLLYKADSSYYFERIRHLPWPVFFDSTHNTSQDNRYDIIAAAPFKTLTTKGTQTLIETQATKETLDGDPFHLIQQQLAQHPPQAASKLPFCGGAIGLFTYDLGRQIEKLPNIASDNEEIPEMLVGIYDWAIITDHYLKQCFLASFKLDKSTEQQWDGLLAQLRCEQTLTPEPMVVSGELTSQLEKNQYKTAFNKVKHYIHEGDCYQVNLAKRFEINAKGDPWHAYTLLRGQNPAPFSSFFSTPHLSIMSSSPERLLKLEQGQVETKPIKGTRPRDLTNPEQDSALANELQNSVKDRAENLMIVDLLRNDLGKVCRPGSIAVPKPFALESFATVHHLVSTITGELTNYESATSLLRACFPGGSITGAPKLRAMEIIEELEPDRRGAYCGSMAYIGFDGNMDSNILIRTLVYNNNKLRFWAGGGIVADSDVEQEYQEIHDKAAAILNVIEKLR